MSLPLRLQIGIIYPHCFRQKKYSHFLRTRTCNWIYSVEIVVLYFIPCLESRAEDSCIVLARRVYIYIYNIWSIYITRTCRNSTYSFFFLLFSKHFIMFISFFILEKKRKHFFRKLDEKLVPLNLVGMISIYERHPNQAFNQRSSFFFSFFGQTYKIFCTTCLLNS